MWEMKKRRGGACILRVVYLVCEGQTKFPGGL